MSLARVLVTGGSGFIGTNLIDACAAAGWRVANFDVHAPKKAGHRGYWLQGDMLDKDAIARAIAEFQPTAVAHLAARTDLDETCQLGAYAVNFDGTDNLIQAARNHAGIKRVVFVSTMLVTRPGHVPRSDAEYSAHTLYGQSKVLMEKRIRSAGNLPFVWSILRPPLVWGPWVSAHYQNFFRLVARGRYFHIGGGRAIRTLGYVDNVVKHIITAATASAEKVQERVFYVGDDQPTVLADWAEEIRRQLGAPPIRSMPYSVARIAATAGDVLGKLGIRTPISTFRLGNIVTDWVLPVQPMANLSSLTPTTLPDGVAATIAWMRAEKLLT
ncbi:MAG TPA: NAD(P)-dependent oxidoreductase [Gemmatimonadaceae bacterium]|nr:NAD(P)-dependent oxidoreductase [Gemmatimonadaceae bacterium]